MKKRHSETRRGRAGFTLIEVLLVVAILGILATVVVVGVSGRQEKAMIAAARSSIKALSTAVDMYEVDTGRYPSGLQALMSNDGAPNWNGPYVKTEPIDPWGQPFRFTVVGENSYKISSDGPDRSSGSGDDITN